MQQVRLMQCLQDVASFSHPNYKPPTITNSALKRTLNQKCISCAADNTITCLLRIDHLLQEIAHGHIAVFVHDIVTFGKTLSEMPREKCPVFNPFNSTSIDKSNEVLIPQDEILIR